MNGIERKNIIGLILAAAVVAPALGGTVEQWCDTAAGELQKQRLRGAAAINGIVAIRCAVEPEHDARLASACAAVRHELARSISQRRFDVVEPRNGFAVVSTWEHVSCGRGGGSSYLGRDIVEIRMSRKRDPRRRRDDLVVLSAYTGGRETPLTESELGWTELESIGGNIAQAAQPPFFISQTNTREELFASHLADLLACPLKQLPEKHILRGVTVRGEVASPAQLEWAEHVGDRLTAHLNRVLRSGYVFPGDSVLELSVRSGGGGAVQVVPRLLLADADETRVLIDGDHLCADGQCLVEFSERLSPLLGDLRFFDNDLNALARHLRRRGLRLELERVAADDAPGVIVGQSPGASTPVIRIPYGEVEVYVSAGPSGSTAVQSEAPRLASSEQTRLQVEAVGDALDLSVGAVDECLRAVEQGGSDAAALYRLLRKYDPRTRDETSLPGLWRAWYEFAHPLYEPYFPGSPVNAFVEEVEGALFERLDRAVFGELMD